MANDWTFDYFMEDARAYHATPRKGIYPDSRGDYRRYFMVTFKNWARDFKTKWLNTHQHLYDRNDGYVGDAFAHTLTDCFSDFYKDAYGQRPHLPVWYYVQATGLPQSEDTARTFCADPVGEAETDAKAVRATWEREEAGIA